MALSYLALCLHDKGNYREALETARAAVAAGPGECVAHAACGLALRATGKNDDAIAALKEALRLDPDQALPVIWLSDILREKGRWAEAEGILRNAHERFPQNVAIMAVLGRVLVDLKRIDEAEPFIKDALAAAPDNTTALVSAGCLALAKGNDRQAQEFALWALQQDATNAPAIELSCLIKAKRYPIFALWFRWAWFYLSLSESQRQLAHGAFVASLIVIPGVLRRMMPTFSVAILVVMICVLAAIWSAHLYPKYLIKRELGSVKVRPSY
jgi:tetratricopeptide (TPR) repeat protein